MQSKNKQLYFSCMFDNSVYQSIFTKEKKPMPAANKYHMLLCRGLAQNGVFVSGYSQLPVTTQNCERRYVKKDDYKENGFVIEYITFLNVPLIKHLLVFVKAIFRTVFTKTSMPILIDVLPISLAMGAAMGAKISHKKCVGIVTDLPEFLPGADKSSILKSNQKILKMCDGFVLLTEEMNKKVNVDGKPYIVLEGHADSSMEIVSRSVVKKDKKVVLYAGGLQKEYGIEKLCKAFIQCHEDNEELHVYGDGEYAEELRELCIYHPEIKYYGNCRNEVVVEDELIASLLVNPRPAEGEFTKYSFPSKTMEYMASGTAVLMTRLPGIPEEYYQYTYTFEDESQEGFTRTLRKVLDFPTSILDEKGKEAKRFVIENKSNVVQASRVLEFIIDL